MRNIGYSVIELIASMKEHSIDVFMKTQKQNFVQRFGIVVSNDVEVTLIFDCAQDAIDCSNELRYNRKYSSMYTSRCDRDSVKRLRVSGAKTLYDYFGSREPNLLTLSRELGISFTIDYRQEYSGLQFNGKVHQGELLSRQCIVEYTDLLPELGLGCLDKIGRSAKEFDALLTRIYRVKSEVIL